MCSGDCPYVSSPVLLCAAASLTRCLAAVAPPRVGQHHVHVQAPLPLGYSQASPGRSFPAFQRYYEGAKTTWSSLPPLLPPACSAVPCRSPVIRYLPRRGSPLRSRALVSRSGPIPAFVYDREAQALPGSRDAPIPLCHALGSRSGRLAPGLLRQAGTAPLGTIRKTPAIICLSGFDHMASRLAAYASCRPYGTTTQCSLPAGGLPLPDGSGYPLGIICIFPHVTVSWFPMHRALPGATYRFVERPIVSHLHFMSRGRSMGPQSVRRQDFAIFTLVLFGLSFRNSASGQKNRAVAGAQPFRLRTTMAMSSCCSASPVNLFMSA